MLQQIAAVESHDSAGKLAPRWLCLLSLLAAVLMALQALSLCYSAAGLDRVRGASGMKFSYDCDADRFCHLSAVRPGLPAERAGIRPGDEIRLDRYWERHRVLRPGDFAGLTVRRNGTIRHLVLTAGPRPAPFVGLYVASGLINLAICMIALLVLARAGRRWPGLFLGLVLVAYGLPGNYPRLWQNDPALYPWFLLGLSLWVVATPVLMLLALRAFRAEIISRVPRWLDRLIQTAAAAELSIFVWGATVELGVAPVLGVSDGLSLWSLGSSVGSLIAPLALAAGWREVPAESRTRYAFMWAAVSVISVYALIDPLIMLTGSNYAEASWPVLIQFAALLLGTILFAYAILRHRVIDLGFAINRTLVFSALSFLTLMVFGLVEWASERLIPLESREASAVIEAGVALALFMVFHRIHAWIEQLVEGVFFHRWQANEAALLRFCRQASYITRADVLIERAVGELRSFTGGATAVFYRAVRGGYEVAAGDAVRRWIDADEPALVEMRADQALVHDAFVVGGMALPMTHRADVTGLVVLGPKPSGDPYRPDEEAQLAEAVRSIGLDLYALRVEELEEENSRLLARIEAGSALRRTIRAKPA